MFASDSELEIIILFFLLSLLSIIMPKGLKYLQTLLSMNQSLSPISPVNTKASSHPNKAI